MQSERIPDADSPGSTTDDPEGFQTRWRRTTLTVVGALLCLFTLSEVNYPRLAPQSQLAIFALLGLVLCFLHHPLSQGLRKNSVARASDVILAFLAVLTCGYFVVQTEPAFANFWTDG